VVAARPATCRRLRQALGDAGMEVVAACDDTVQLLAAVSREKPDVCVVDRELPGGGLAATAAIASPRDAPKVLVVGGHGASVEVRAARLAGAADCVPSDTGAAELAAAVFALVRKEQP
jgi:DNA-binding NarL/FixJ family response regulator